MRKVNSNKGIARDASEDIIGGFGVVTNENFLDIRHMPKVLVGIHSVWLKSTTCKPTRAYVLSE